MFEIIALIGVLCAGVPPAHGQSADGHKVAGMEAFLYFHETGTRDTVDVIDGHGDRHELWNAIVGEGDLPGPTHATMVLVKVEGSFDSQARGSLRLTARTGSGVLFARTLSYASFFSERSAITIPFLVYGTGCSPVTLVAASLDAGGEVEHSITEHISFHCGE